MEDKYKIDDNDAFNWTLKKKLSEYNQEELAEELFSYKNDLKNDANIRIGGEYGFSITTIGLDTAEEFLDKYGEILDKAGMPRSNKVQEKVEKVEEKKAPVANKPLGKLLTDYTQEEFAALMMDNKTDELDSVVKFRNHIFTTQGCKTAEDFINKYQEDFKALRIKPAVKEEKAEVVEQPIKEETPIIEEPQIEEIKVEAPVVEEEKEEETIINKEVLDVEIETQNFVPALLEMFNRKLKIGKEIESKYKNIIVSTEGCTSVEEMIIKYKDIIAGIMHQETEEILKTNIGREGKYLFALDRGNIYNSTLEEAEAIDEIDRGDAAYKKLISLKDQINFKNKKQVSAWLEELIPYVNTHALTLNLDSNSPDKYLLNLMAEKGYTTDITYDNIADYDSYSITEKLRDLQEYGFFAGEYVNLPIELRRLNSDKTLAIAKVKSLDKEFGLCGYGIEQATKALEESRKETDAEKAAIEAYRKAYDSPLIENVSYATELINAISNEDMKVELTQALNKAVAVNENKGDIYPVSIEDLDNAQTEREQKLNGLKSKYEDNKKEIFDTMVNLKKTYKIGDDLDISKIEENINNFVPSVDDTIEKLKEEAYNEYQEEQEQEDDNDKDDMSGGTKEDEEEDLNFDFTYPDVDTIDQFTAINSFKRITKELYDKLTSVKYKTVLQEAINQLNIHKRAVINGIGLAVSIVGATVTINNTNADNLLQKQEAYNTALDTLENSELAEEVTETIENSGKSL